MTNSAWWWLFFNLFSIVVLAFYSMMEMACVSFNKIRLHYYVSKGDKRAIWLNYLLLHPFRLFGTTLIGVNIAMFAGSECAREFHSAIGLSPDLAPLTQVALVIIFGELAPMFAARRYAENVAMLGIPLVYISARLMTPLIWIVGAITKGCIFFLHSKRTSGNLFISQEELQLVLEEHGEEGIKEDFNIVTSHIFQLGQKVAHQVLTPIQEIPRLPSSATVFEIRDLLKKIKHNYVAIYFKDIRNIVGIVLPRDLIRIADQRRVRDKARPPWFVTELTKVTEILKQFKKNNQTVAVVLDKHGKAVGVITLEDVLNEIFGENRD